MFISDAFFLKGLSIKITVLDRNEIVGFRLPYEAGRIRRLDVLFKRISVEKSFCLFIFSFINIGAKKEPE